MTNLTVSVDNQSFDRVGITKDCQDAICELIWNGLEADAQNIVVSLTEDEFLKEAPFITVEDDGTGINFSTIKDTFGAFLSSQKKQKSIRIKTQSNKGKGRFSYMALSHEATWITAYRENDKVYEYNIQLTQTDKRNVSLSDRLESKGTKTFTRVTIPLADKKTIEQLRLKKIKQKLLEEFAWYLYLHKEHGVTIDYCGEKIDYTEYINTDLSSDSVFQIDGNDFRISIIVWKNRIDNSSKVYYMTSSNENIYAYNTSFNNNAVDFYHGGFVMSKYFDDMPVIIDSEDASAIELKEGQRTVLSQLKKEIRRKIDSTLREYMLHRADAYLNEEETIQSLPRFEQNDIGEAKKKDFTRVVREMYCIEPKIFYRLKQSALTAIFGFIQLLLDSNERDNIIYVMEQIVSLTAEQRDQFVRVLHNTKLENVISIVDLLQQRNSVISSLKALVYDATKFVNERDHIQRIIENHFWLFGDQYSLVSADVRVKKSLELFEKELGIKNETSSQLSKEEQRQRMDIVLYASRLTDEQYQEGLIVELKAPSVVLSAEVLSQIERYANIIRREPRFSGISRKWKFMAICSSIDDDVTSKYEGYRQHGKPGLVSIVGNFEIYALTWDEIFICYDKKFQFLTRKLQEDMQEINQDPELIDDPSREKVNACVDRLLGAG